MSANRSSGFSLIELMITVAVIGILAAIAYPSYLEYVREARRSDARVNLLELSQFMERYHTSNGMYLNTSNAAPTLPYNESPKDGSTKYYDLSFSSINANSYTLKAEPKAGSAMAGDRCGTLTYSFAGVKGASGDVDDCWGR
ncbi:type IV pilin protein [Marinobacterium ramblicola]|uniref:type IV pilin protein n=1 Tax=Marinobacterium ramblicola TaxID=2849041 RepID=UPI0024848B66|nr:type IV pilin protein [Marinobacterium ramblicola]